MEADIHDRVHLAADAGVMDRDNGASAGSDGSLDLCFVDVEGIAPDVDDFTFAWRSQNAFAVETKV